MGMAVDANVLIYERIKEELRAGKSHKAAVTDGYKNAMSAIVDSNLTTVLTGIILFYFGTGPIKGFATTLIIGIITSFFTAVFVTRLIYSGMSENGSLSKWTFTTKLSKNLLTNVKVNWLKLRKASYVAAGIMVIGAIASLFTLGLNQGIDFTGGRNYVVRFNENVNTEDIKDLLEDGFQDASVSVITIGNDKQVRISTNYKITDNSQTVDDEVESILYTELQGMFEGQGVSKDMFINGYVLNDGKAELATEDATETLGIQSSQKVSAAIADDIKFDASLAILLSIIGIGLYILARFRNISYSTGALFALVHDVIFIVGAYSLLYKIMPFSMEIDQSFIAAILTIVGYSINDKVVVFDRVREIIGMYPKRDRGEVINEAINATLIRTLSTSLSTALVLIVILLLGGETIRGFVFAMLLGVIVGTYSTIFIAVPAAYDFIKKGDAKKLKK
jgi:SecD/SecF fusion protein